MGNQRIVTATLKFFGLFVFGFRRLKHADDLLLLFDQTNDRRRKSEPAVKEQIISTDAASAGLFHQFLEHSRGFTNTFGSALESVGPFIDLSDRRFFWLAELSRLNETGK